MRQRAGAVRRSGRRIGRKLLVTTAISVLLFGLAYAVIRSDWLSFRVAAPGLTIS